MEGDSDGRDDRWSQSVLKSDRTSLNSLSIEVEGGLTVCQSADEMKMDIIKARKAIELFMQAKFIEAETFLTEQENYKTSLYMTYGMAMLLYTKSMFTLDPEDVDLAKEVIGRTLLMARKLRKDLAKPSLAARLYRVLSWSAETVPADECTGRPLKEEDVSFVLAQAELIEAETSILMSCLRIIGEPDGMNYMVLLKEVWNVRRGYIYYRQFEGKEGKAGITRLHSELAENNEHQSGVYLGNGIINICFSVMPPSIAKVFAVIGYKGDGQRGIDQLTKCSETDSVRSHIADLILLFYYTVMMGSLSGDTDEGAYGFEDRLEATQKILDSVLKTYPDSPLFLCFQGRADFLRRDVKAALETYHRAIQSSSESWPTLRLAIYWDVVLGYMRMLQFEDCLKYSALLARDSKWSLVFCMYLEIVFRSATARIKDDQSLLEPIDGMFAELPSLEKRIAGRAFPMERFAITRGQMILDGRCELVYPEYELMTLWGSYIYMDTETLGRAEQDVLAGLDGDISDVSKELLRVSLAAIHRTQGNLREANGSFSILTSIIKSPPEILCSCHTHLLPLAHLELAATLIDMDDLKEAKVHFNIASKWKVKHYLDRTIQVRCSKLAHHFRKK